MCCSCAQFIIKPKEIKHKINVYTKVHITCVQDASCIMNQWVLPEDAAMPHRWKRNWDESTCKSKHEPQREAQKNGDKQKQSIQQ